jgi:peroxiredoxin
VPPVDMRLPDFHGTGAFALPRVEHEELANERPIAIVFEANENEGDFLANGEEFDHMRTDLFPKLGTAEEWAISSARDTHPFHIHVNPFEVIEGTGAGARRYWKDTLVVTRRNPPWNPLYIRMRFEDFAGETVLHCHNLVHEDRGMMMKVQIAGPLGKTECDEEKLTASNIRFFKAPAWKLINAKGEGRRLREFEDEKILLVFFQGMGCAHCRRQLDELAKRRGDLKQQGLKVIAVSPDSPQQLRDGLKVTETEVPGSFELLSDESLEVFRRYGVHDGQPRHGVFLIDRDGIVRWQHVSDEPFMEIDSLLAESELLDVSRQADGEGGSF